MSLSRPSHSHLAGLALALSVAHCTETTCEDAETCASPFDASISGDVIADARLETSREDHHDGADAGAQDVRDATVTEATPDASADSKADADVGATCQEAGACGCVDPQSDPHHCGACGHDCLGQPCRDGLCVPVLVASQQGRPRYIAVDSEYLYWASESADASRSAILRAPKVTAGSGAGDTDAEADGGDALSSHGAEAVAIAEDLDTVFDVTAASGYVYWAQYLPGRGSTIRRIRREGGQAQDIAKLGAVIYAFGWYNGNLYAAGSGGIYRFRLLDGADAGTDWWPTAESATAIAVGPSGIYWTQIGMDAISRVVVGGGQPVVAAMATGCAATAIAIDSTNLYWGCRNSDGTGQELRAPLSEIDGGTGVPIGRTSQPFGMIAEGPNVYWCDVATGAILWTPSTLTSASSQARELARYEDKDSCVDGFAVDATSIYWTNARTGTVMKTPKPSVP